MVCGSTSYPTSIEWRHFMCISELRSYFIWCQIHCSPITRCYRWCVDSDSADEVIPYCCITQKWFPVLMRAPIWTNSETDRFGSPIQTFSFYFHKIHPCIFLLSELAYFRHFLQAFQRTISVSIFLLICIFFSYLSSRIFVIFFRHSSEQFLFLYFFLYVYFSLTWARVFSSFSSGIPANNFCFYIYSYRYIFLLSELAYFRHFLQAFQRTISVSIFILIFIYHDLWVENVIYAALH